MFLAAIPGHLFFTTGKTGTRTLLSVPGMNELSNVGSNKYHSWTYLEPSAALRAIEQYKLNNDCKLHIIVREPHSRLVSGMFEIVAKKIVNVAALDAAAIDYYSSVYWHDITQAVLDLGPTVFDEQHIAAMPFWRFHIGNWINSALKAQSAFDADIVKLEDLNSLLDSLNLTYAIRNTSKDFVNKSNLNFNIVYQQFTLGFGACESYAECCKYIESDIKLYNSL